MGKVVILTDSSSGIRQAEAQQLGISVLPMPFFINGETLFEDINLTQDTFYEHLTDGAEISTSMPAVGDLTDRWDELLKEYDEVVYIPLSSGLSSSCETATALSMDDEYEGKVFVVNNQRISVTQKQSVFDAIKLAESGKSGKEIKDILEDAKFQSSIYIMVDTLYYLKKGGRIPAALAVLGNMLHIKPVIELKDKTLTMLGKARGRSGGIKYLWKEFESYEIDENEPVYFGYTSDRELGEKFMKDTVEKYGLKNYRLYPVGGIIGTHVGPACAAISFVKKSV